MSHTQSSPASRAFTLLLVIAALSACGYFIINVSIEGNLIKPLVMRPTLQLNPLAVIFAVMARGELLGFRGIILAIPTAAAVKVCTAETRELLQLNVRAD